MSATAPESVADLAEMAGFVLGGVLLFRHLLGAPDWPEYERDGPSCPWPRYYDPLKEPAPEGPEWPYQAHIPEGFSPRERWYLAHGPEWPYTPRKVEA